MKDLGICILALKSKEKVLACLGNFTFRASEINRHLKKVEENPRRSQGKRG
jgi:hypothetical protein